MSMLPGSHKYSEPGTDEPGLVLILDVLSKDSYAFVEEAIARAIEESEHCTGITLLSIYPDEED